jgi:hypothetical protein
MASFTQQQQQQNTTKQRDLYRITRSEATELVSMYMFAQKESEYGGIEHLRAFRNELESAPGAYLGKYNNSNEGKFYKIASVFYNVIGELSRRVDENDHDYKITLMAKLFPCSKYIAEDTSTYLNWAVYNWHFIDAQPPPHYGCDIGDSYNEELDDNCYETNKCAVCGFEGEDVFYFSTSYELESPVCDICIRCTGDDEEDIKHDDDDEYIVEEEDDEEEDEEDDDDEDDEEDEEDNDEEDDDEEDEDEEDEEDDDEEDDEEDEEEETGNIFGCVGCNYEWRDGWKHGYKAALKKMRKTSHALKKDMPEAPRCANCDDSHGNLKKCGRCESVRYCSLECQKADWKRSHKHVCNKA